MGRPSKKRHVEEDAASSDEDVVKPSKKAKTKTTTTSEDGPGKDSEGNPFWPLGTTRRITIQNFKGKNYVNIREYYEHNGELKPGKKGIMLPLEQYNAFLTAIPAINAELELKGHEVPDIFANAPTASTSKSPAKSSAKSPSKEQKRKKKKMNIEATSDEEDPESS